MNRKGLYSGIVAVIALAIIAGFVFSSLGIVQAEETRADAESIADFKRQMRNIEFVLLKSSADALADSIWIGGAGPCTFDQPTAEAQLTAYMTAALGGLASTFPNCNIANVTAVLAPGSPPPPGTVTIGFDLTCQKNVGGSSISYDKAYSFPKTYDLPPPAPFTCRVQITDDDFGLEVDQSI